MARAIFPAMATQQVAKTATLPPLVDGAWDFERDEPIFRQGEPVQVTGLAAVQVFAYHALKTRRYRHPMFSTDVGTELETLMGRPFGSETQVSEARRLITEGLLVCPYITAVGVSDLVLRGGVLSATVTLSTVYGEGKINV